MALSGLGVGGNFSVKRENPQIFGDVKSDGKESCFIGNAWWLLSGVGEATDLIVVDVLSLHDSFIIDAPKLTQIPWEKQKYKLCHIHFEKVLHTR